MALSKNIAEYEDCREWLDRALSSANGIRKTLPDNGKAIYTRQRLYKLRQLEKIASIDTYEVGDERRSKTAWDNLTIEVVDNCVEIRHAKPIEVEEL
jgi:hypothetical protein